MEASKVYDVVLETTATLDLYGILDYNTEVLKSPESASRIYRLIKNQVLSLDVMPYRFPLVREEPFASMGVHLMPVESYNAFYIINEQKSEVHILRILYNRREWQNIL